MAVTLYLGYKVNSQSVGNNSSNVTVSVEASWTYGSYNKSKTAGNLNINGVNYPFTASFNTGQATSGTQVLFSKTVDVPHNTDGTKTLECSASYDTQVSSGTIYGSFSRELPTIARATTPTVSNNNVSMGSLIRIETPRASDNFTHDLAYSFVGEAYVSIATGVGTYYDWTTPDLATKIPNATSGTVTIRCITKNSGTAVGTEYTTMTLRVNDSVVPTVSVSVSEATAGIAAQFGGYVKGKSTLKVVITAAGAKGSTIKSYYSTFDGQAYDQSSFTTPALSTNDTLNLIVTVSDSRGRSASKTVPIVVMGYAVPTISSLQLHRVNAAGEADSDGKYVAVRYAYSVQPLNNKNTASMVLEYKRSVDSNWSTLLTNSALSADTTAKPTSVTFSVDYQYDFRMTVTDWFGEGSDYPATLPSGAVILDIKADGKGLGFFTTANREGVDLSMAKVHLGPEWQTASLTSSFALYNTAQPVQYRRYGDLVEVRGVIKPTATIPYADGWTTITTLPEGYRPGGLTDVEVVCQGGSNAIWLLRVTLSGAVQFSRYRNGSTNADVTAGTRLPFSVLFFTDT